MEKERRITVTVTAIKRFLLSTFREEKIAIITVYFANKMLVFVVENLLDKNIQHHFVTLGQITTESMSCN